MIRKLCSIITLAVMFLATAGCQEASSQESSSMNNIQAGSAGMTPGNKILVAYFSCTGTTEQIVKMIVQETGADIYQITPKTPYNTADLNYRDSSTRATREQNDPQARPAISGPALDLRQYDTIFLGYPIWWGQAPRIISTFLESHDLNSKTIIPFTTSHSSGLGSSDTNLHGFATSANWKPGIRFSAQTSPETVRTWVHDMNIPLGNAQSIGVFDFETKTVLLNSGYRMPIVGIGTYSLSHDVCVKSVTEHLKAGGRLIDTAFMYHNEKAVGQGVRESGVPREEVFVITKLYPSQFANAEAAIEEALKKLDLGYIDMMLLHHPGAYEVEAYKAMEQAVKVGKIRSIGLSCYYIAELERFLPQVAITPALVQNEIHPYYQDNNVIPFIQDKGIVVQGWYPLGGRKSNGILLKDPVIVEIGLVHNKSSAQVILRWNLQKSVVVIPGTSNPAHIRENLDIFDFELTNEEMARINALDRNQKYDWY